MKYKIGETLYSCHLGEDTKRPQYSQWRVRTRRGGKVYAVNVNAFTWIKLRWGKDQTMGWAAQIPPCWRCQCDDGGKFDWLFRTKKQALTDARMRDAEREKRIARIEQGGGE